MVKESIQDALDLLRDRSALRRYLGENKQRIVPLAVAGLLVVAAVVFAASSFSQPYTESAQIEPSGAGQDTGLDRLDTDGDNVSDLQELYTYGTDPARSDTDGDGIPDGWEAEHRRLDPISNTYSVNPLLNDSGEDPDGDGLTNLEEFQCGSDPWKADTDGDGMDDAFECRYDGLDPRTAAGTDGDPDGDGLTNIEEAEHGTDPFSADTDHDGISDPDEIFVHHTNPVAYSTAGHGISDGYLLEHDLNLTEPGVSFMDPDDDGLSNLEEFRWSRDSFNPGRLPTVGEDYASWLDPRNPDSDGDTMDDGWEVRYQLDPLDPGDADGDFDDDGLLNRQEAQVDSDPRSRDTDGDGLDDPEEVEGWTVKVDGEEVHVTSDPTKADTDGDFLTDRDEQRGFGSVAGRQLEFCPDGPCSLDPRSPDTDLDGLSDSFEVLYQVEPKLDPTDPDTDGDGLRDKAELDHWRNARESMSDDGLSRIRDQGQLTTCQGVDATTLDEVRSALAPQGDIDGDGIPNIVDPDSDCDTIPDGEELDPPRREAAPGSKDTYLLPVTDPALVDTDGEGLPDAWENKYARWNYDRGNWNLNASDEDSLDLNDGKTDADRDLDEDGVTYSEGYVKPRAYVHDNLAEFESGTDPNAEDTDGDGIPDGWEVFFQRVSLGSSRPVDLDPLDPRDAGDVSKSLTYTRFAEAPADLVDAYNETVAQTYESVPDPDGGQRDVVKVQGRFDLTYRGEFNASTDPTLLDTDGDGMEDTWELYYKERAAGAGAQFNPHDPSGASRDADGDGLSNRVEAMEGTDPVLEDSDLGGIPDGDEVSGDFNTDPMFPKDDDPNGDVDFDGIPNSEELTRSPPTDVADFDTDNDGLLDGTDLKESELSATATQRFLDAGIVYFVTDGGERVFLGEETRTPATDPTKPDSDGDGLPDGWVAFYEVRYGLDTSDTRNDDDALSDLQEYELGMPDDWNLETDGVWWFGSNPVREDTDGDGASDGVIVDSSTVLGNDYDYDNDGLNDFNGEDPHPLLDPDNAGDRDPRDPALVRSYVWEEGRVTGPSSDDRPTPSFQNVDVTYPRSENVAYKGGHVTVTGRLDASADLANVPVLVNLLPVSNAGEARPAEGRVLGVGFTDGSGSFEVTANLTRTTATSVPADLTLFGTPRAAGSTVSWGVNTSTLDPGFDYRVVVWSYGTDDVLTTFTDPHTVGDSITIRTGSTWQAPEEVALTNGRNLQGSFTLTDDVGDPLTSRDVRVEWRGSVLTRATTDATGTITLDEPTEPFNAPGTHDLTLIFPDSELVEGTTVTVPVNVRFPTTLEASVDDETLTAVAGRTLPTSGRLVDSRGLPVTGARVDVSFLDATTSTSTDSEGRWSARVPVSEKAPVGNRKVSVSFEGNDRHVPASTDAGIVTVKQVAQVFVSVDKGALGEPLVLRGELRDLAGLPVRDSTVDHALQVTLQVGNRSRTAPVDNATSTFRVELPADAIQEPGNVSVHADFQGSPLYASSTTQDRTFVRSVTHLDVPAKPVTRGETMVVEGFLTDNLGNAVADAPVSVVFETADLGTVTTDAEGRFQVTHPIPEDRPLGSALVRAEYAGSPDGALAPAGPVSTFYHVRADTSLTIADRTVRTGPIPVNGTLVDGEDRPVVAAPITVSFNGVEQTAFTDFSGRFQLTFDGSRLSPQNVTVKASYPGSNRFSDVTATAHYRVLSDTNIVVRSLTPLVRGEVFTLKGELHTNLGEPVKNAPVKVLVNGSLVTTGRTSPDGSFLLQGGLDQDLPRGSTILEVRYAGDSNHVEAVHASEVQIQGKPNIQVTVPRDLTVGEDFTGTIRLVDDEGDPIKNSQVRVRFSGFRYPITLTTNETGVATFPGRVTSAGTSDVTARFTGSQSQLPQTSSTTLVASESTFTQAAPPILLALLALGIVGLGIYGYLRWRRGLVEEAGDILRAAEEQLAAGNEYEAVIMQTYRALVSLVSRVSDVEDRPDLTAREFAAAAEDALPVQPDHLRTLVDIFDEARYSVRPAGPEMRDRAVANLRALQQDLSEGKRWVTAPGNPGGEPT